MPPDVLVFFVADPVDDVTATAVRSRAPGLGFFDDPAAQDPGDRTTGCFVRVSGRRDVDALWEAALRVSADLAVTVELQWREEVLGRVRHGKPDPGLEAAVLGSWRG